MSDVDTILSNAQRPEMSVDIYLGQPDLPHERERLNRLTKRTDEEQAKLDALTEQVRAATLAARVRAIPHRKWAQIVVDHPPREDNPEDKKAGVNTLTFWATVVPLCLPDLTPDQYEQLDGVISEGEWQKLCGVVEVVNMRPVTVPKSLNGLPASPVSAPT